jgi:hypothetical protein
MHLTDQVYAVVGSCCEVTVATWLAAGWRFVCHHDQQRPAHVLPGA